MLWTLLELVFVALIAVGVGLELGAGWALVAAGLLGLWLSWMAGGGDE